MVSPVSGSTETRAVVQGREPRQASVTTKSHAAAQHGHSRLCSRVRVRVSMREPSSAWRGRIPMTAMVANRRHLFHDDRLGIGVGVVLTKQDPHLLIYALIQMRPLSRELGLESFHHVLQLAQLLLACPVRKGDL